MNQNFNDRCVQRKHLGRDTYPYQHKFLRRKKGTSGLQNATELAFPNDIKKKWKKENGEGLAHARRGLYALESHRCCTTNVKTSASRKMAKARGHQPCISMYRA
jgi:hypothetical protein